MDRPTGRQRDRYRENVRDRQMERYVDRWINRQIWIDTDKRLSSDRLINGWRDYRQTESRHSGRSTD